MSIASAPFNACAMCMVRRSCTDMHAVSLLQFTGMPQGCLWCCLYLNKSSSSGAMQLLQVFTTHQALDCQTARCLPRAVSCLSSALLTHPGSLRTSTTSGQRKRQTWYPSCSLCSLTPGAPENARTICTCDAMAPSTMASGESICQRHSLPTEQQPETLPQSQRPHQNDCCCWMTMPAAFTMPS